jgi:uncharacterized protein YjeT (DUF2065 family)
MKVNPDPDMRRIGLVLMAVGAANILIYLFIAINHIAP